MTPSAFVAPVCCPTETHVCQRTLRSHRCVAKEEAEACKSCCAAEQGSDAACSFATGAQIDGGDGIMRPEIKALQCCGMVKGQPFCCAARSPASSSSGLMRPQSPPQQCKAVPGSFDCEDLPSGWMAAQVTVSLAAWQIAMVAVGGFLCCGAITGGGHRYHGGHCGDDCQACGAFLAGCAIFECCCRGGKGAGEPLLPA